RSLGGDVVIDYKKQKFEEVLRDYDAVPGESLEKSFQILNPKSTVISLVGPPDAAFGRTRDMNSLVLFVLWLLSRKVHRLATKRDVDYSFLFVHPDGGQLAEIGELLKVGIIRPVIDKVFPFGQVKE